MSDNCKSSDDVFINAARCADCTDPACMKACPEYIDLNALFEFVAAQAPLRLAALRKAKQAEELASEAINDSFH